MGAVRDEIQVMEKAYADGLNAKDGNVMKTGKYISLFEKLNGKYVCIRDNYNEDQK